MKQIDLHGNNVFFIGIGGSSMSGLALLLKKEGFNVSGSDMQSSVKVEHLEEKGIKVKIGHNAENLMDCNADVVVYTAAVSNDNPELCYAREHGIHTMKRAELVGEIMGCYENAAGISGTKGKTTTTALLSTILMEAGLEPSALIGGTAKNIGSNVKVGTNDYIVAESCEYQDSFLDFKPTVAVILNIELEHTDYFKSIEQLEDSFLGFTLRTPEDGLVVGCADCDVTMRVMGRSPRNKVTYGINNEADYMAKNIVQNKNGTLSLDIYRSGEFEIAVNVPICGVHNAYNILAAYIVARYWGLKPNVIAEALTKYLGAGRRFDLYGTVNGASVYDDYAHTPDEYRAVIAAAKGLEHNRLIGIFQPHTYSRSIDFFDETVDAFKECDEVIMLDIYAAREKDEGKIHSRDFAKAMCEKGMDAKYIPNYDDVTEYIVQNAKENDIVLVIGAGHSNVLCEKIVHRGIPTDKPHGD